MNKEQNLDRNWFTERCDQQGAAYSMLLSSEILHSEQSPYQKIDIYNTKNFGHLMVIDGCIMLTAKDNFLYHEMISHPALFSHPEPKSIVIIGGGDCGTLKEVLKHQGVEQVLQVEIDERVTRLAEQYFPELCESNQDPRAEFYFGDGIKWMQEAADNSIDIIIVDSTDPIGPAEGLFNKAFYQQCRRVLGENGLLVQQSESPIFHFELLKAMRNAMTDAGFKQCQTLNFPQPCYPSGWWTATIASCNTNCQQFREQASEQKPFATKYYNKAIHQAALAAPEFFKDLA